MEGMLVVDTRNFPTGTLFYVYNGNIQYKDVGMQNAGFTTGITFPRNRVVNRMGDGGQWSLTLFEMTNARLVARQILFSDVLDIYLGDGESTSEQLVYDGDQNLISHEDYLAILDYYDLHDWLPPWWNRTEDDRELILSMVID